MKRRDKKIVQKKKIRCKKRITQNFPVAQGIRPRPGANKL